MKKYISLMICILCISISYAQSNSTTLYTEQDSTISDSIVFHPEAASLYIQSLMEKDRLWRNENDPLKQALEHLLLHYYSPFDTIGAQLLKYNYDSIQIEHTPFVKKRKYPLRWLNDSSFIFDTINLPREPYLTVEHIIDNERNLDILFQDDTLPSLEVLLDSVFQEADTIYEVQIDSAYLDSLSIPLYSFKNGQSQPEIRTAPNTGKIFLSDSSAIVFSDTSWAFVADNNSPFNIVPNLQLPDSLSSAVREIISYTNHRDSIPLFINPKNGYSDPFWISQGHELQYRYWIKNYKNDSISIWVGNPASNTVSVLLEDDVNINRMSKKIIDDIPITLAKPETELTKVDPLKKIPEYWDYKVSSSFAFSQTYITEWAKGGESAITSLLDIKGDANYTDTKNKTKWLNNARLKYGSIYTAEKGMRTNNDMLTLNSKFNKMIKGKFDFSATFYGKTQISKGYKYPTVDSSVMVSKFLNPGTFTIGLGTEYKPFKHTQITLSPLSYKNTFVTDTTANENGIAIDPTKHGIEAGSKSKQEIGSQLVVKNKLNILEGLEINNTVRLFASYSAKPANVDVDWELGLKKQITWFFTISANLHTIYDKDILFTEYDDNGDAVKLDDGSVSKVPKIQFKEFIGLSFAFNF